MKASFTNQAWTHIQNLKKPDPSFVDLRFALWSVLLYMVVAIVFGFPPSFV